MYKSVKKTVDENNNFNGYKILTLNDEITFVPNKVNNKDYQDILEWEKIEGNTNNILYEINNPILLRIYKNELIIKKDQNGNNLK